MRIFASIVLLLSIVVIAFLWFLLGASSHNTDLSDHFILACSIILLITILAVINKVWNKSKFWIGIITLEIFIIFYYKFIQPRCEPCLKDQFCPPCITTEQIILKYIGLTIALAFLIWQMISAYRNSASR